MTGKTESLSKFKQTFFVFIPLITLLVVSEIGLRLVHFQLRSHNTFALVGVIKYSRQLLANQRRKAVKKEAKEWTAKVGKELGVAESTISSGLFKKEGKEVLEEFKRIYENNFKSLVTEAIKINSKILVLYLPSSNYSAKNPIRKFYSQLAAKYKIDFLDLTPELSKYPRDMVTLLPTNDHLSRFGNKLVVNRLSEYIDKYSTCKSNFKFKNRPDILGDLPPNQSSIWRIDANMPFLVTVNKQGLRMNYKLTFPKRKQRILILGDSFTFGPYLDNHDAYPNLLDAKYPDKEIINAGIAGYTITDEAPLFIERAKYVEPDITILQVLDNDIHGLFYFKQNIFDRKGKAHAPSRLEREFINKLKAKAGQST